MFVILTALTLATSPGPPPCCLRATTFTDLAQADKTETSHRIGHVLSPAIGTTAFYGAALYFGADRKHARLIAVALSLAAIFAKEVYDYNTEARSFSSHDIVLGVVGTAAGVYVAEVIDWPEEQRERK